MPVVTVRHGDIQVSILLQAGLAMTSDGLWTRPSVSFELGGTSFDIAWLARVPWERCTRIQQLSSFLFIHCNDDQNRGVVAMFWQGGQIDRVKNKVLLRRLYRLFRFKLSIPTRLAVGMSMHPRLGAGSWLAGLGDNILTLVVRQAHN